MIGLLLFVAAGCFGGPVDEDGKPIFREEVSRWVDSWMNDKVDRMAKAKKKGAARYQIDRIRNEPPLAPGASFPLKAGMIGTFNDFSAVQFLEESVFDDAGFLGRVTIKVPSGREQYIVGFRGFDTKGLVPDAILAWDGYFVVRPHHDGPAAAMICEAIDLPAYIEEWIRLHPEAEKPEVKPAAAPVARDPEEEAAGKLKMARALDKAGKQDAYRKVLRGIVEKFPGTKAAKEAEGLLKYRWEASSKQFPLKRCSI